MKIIQIPESFLLPKRWKKCCSLRSLMFQYLEWISSKSSRTSTNSHMIIDLTISSRSTRQLTRINTFVILTSLIIATFRIWNTIATNASGIRIAFVSRLTLADGSSSFIATIGVCSTNLDDGTRIRKTSRPDKKQFEKKNVLLDWTYYIQSPLEARKM